jgi:hypothetical protein
MGEFSGLMYIIVWNLENVQGLGQKDSGERNMNRESDLKDGMLWMKEI